MDTSPSGGDAKRTRRRRSGGGGGGGGRGGLTAANSALQHPAVSRFAPMVMAGAALFYLAGSAGWIYHAATVSGGLWRGMTKTDTRYISGPPAQEGARQWVYVQGDTTVSLNYNDREQSEAILCYTRGAARGACPAFMGIGINTTEDTIWSALGTPDQQRYYGDTKVIAYSGLGVQFTLERFSVKGIAFVPVSRPDLTVFQAVRAMIP
jgi:hypothetical protein